MEKRLTALLNSCSSGNLLSTEGEELRALIEDYFIPENVIEDWSDDEDDDEEGTEQESEAIRSLADGSESSDDETDEAFVHVDKGCGDAIACNSAMLNLASTWSCKCTQIKVVTKAESDTRIGCVSQFTPEEIANFKLSVADMEKASLDMLILGYISACTRMGPETECSKRKSQKSRERPRSTYMLMARIVCRATFCELLGIGLKKLKLLRAHFHQEGLVPRIDGRGGRKINKKLITLQDTQNVVHFIRQYAEDHAVSLPGRVPGFKRDDIHLLPSSCPKSRIYRLFCASAQTAGHRVIGASTFRKLWLQLCPYIVVARPMTDLCWLCQRNNTSIFRSANLTDEEKSEIIAEQQGHLNKVEAERKLYRDMVEDCKRQVHDLGLTQLTQTAPNSRECTMHYSFDYAQQVHYPSNSAQPGPIYFLTPRKCGIFGVCCEGFPKQVNYLIDEAVNSSKGSNGVISYLHNFFEMYGVGEKRAVMHCDNCSGQNKNRYMLWYCVWRVLLGLHDEITLNFMPPGHTKFAPDWCFGLLKRSFRRSEVSCLQDLAEVVKESTPNSGVNIAQLVGREDGTVIVPTYNWQEFFRPACKNLPGIKGIAHFCFSKDHLGYVRFQKTLADEWEQKLLIDPLAFEQLAPMPAVLPPPGLSRERQLYLFNSIREFVRADQRDVVCPNPDHV